MSQLLDDTSTLRRLTLAEWHAIVDAGVFAGDDHIELIDGMIVSIAPQGPLHGHITALLADLLTRALPPDLLVRSHSPLTLGGSEPEPDLAVVERASLRQMGSHPSSARLVVEVSQSSLRSDRFVKAPIYAAASIPELWIVDVKRQVVEVYTRPDAPAGLYREFTTVGVGGTLVPTGFANGEVSVAAIFG